MVPDILISINITVIKLLATVVSLVFGIITLLRVCYWKTYFKKVLYKNSDNRNIENHDEIPKI